MYKDILESLSTTELDKMLNAELRKDTPDGLLFRRILRVLEEREKNYPVEITPKIQSAWDEYVHEDQRRTDRWKPTARNWVIRVGSMAATAAILCIVLFGVIPQPARAETWWEKLFNFTDSVFQFFNPSEKDEVHADYVFQTDNPGLQEVYDAVVELGVTEPVVPMWLPEGYELTECSIATFDSKKCVYAVFTNGELKFIYSVEVYEKNVWHEYQKDEMDVTQYETGGVMHAIMRNVNSIVTVWGTDRIECSISTECQEEDMYKIIDSIYAMEEE